MDSELKSSRIEFLITVIYSGLVDSEDTFSIETSSFLINHYKINRANTPDSFIFQDGSSFFMPSICDLIENCAENEYLYIKVIYKKFSYSKNYDFYP